MNEAEFRVAGMTNLMKHVEKLIIVQKAGIEEVLS